VKKMMMNEDMK